MEICAADHGLTFFGTARPFYGVPAKPKGAAQKLERRSD
jgi:hypothetical protein